MKMKCATVTKVLLGRLALSLALLAASIFRQNIISLIYFVLLLLSPLVPISTSQQPLTKLFRSFLIAIIAYSSVVCLGHLTFQLYLVISASSRHISYDEVIPFSTQCSLIDILQLIGFVRVDTPAYKEYHAVRLILPDGVILLVSVITFIVLRKVCQPADVTASALSESALQPLAAAGAPSEVKRSGIIKRAVEHTGELVIICLIGLSSAMVPSVTSAVYLLVFLGVVLYWSFYLAFNDKAYTIMKRIMFAYIAVHMIALYICQFNYMETVLADHQYYRRLFGMDSLFSTNCSQPWDITMVQYSWPHYVNPVVLFVTFVAVALDIAYHRTDGSHPDEVDDSPHDAASLSLRGSRHRSSERQLLVSTRPQRYDSITSTPPGSPARQPDAAAAEVDRDNASAEVKVTPMADRRHLVRGFSIWSSHERPVLATIRVQLLRISYLAAFVAMLMWAVVFPTWLAFAFLLVGCLIWLFPNSRKASLICSPFLVMYAVGLTGLQYICSINFGGIDYNKSLFFDTDEFVSESVGLVGYDYPVLYITLKLFFTVMFCAVLRALCYERSLTQQRAAASGNDIGLCMLPINSDSGVASDGAPDNRSYDNDNLKVIERRIKDFFSKYWMVLFYILLLVMAIQEPYVYRLVYMVLFLYSAITFQLSYRWWRVSLKVFLYIVALYSIIAIITVYVLAFHTVLLKFRNVTQLQDNTLADLGFDPSINYQEPGQKLELLTRLLVPACLLIAVMLQIHIFHKKFMQITDPHNLRRDRTLTEQTVAERPVLDSGAPDVAAAESNKKRVGFIGMLVQTYNRWKVYGEEVFTAFCRFINLHMYKIVFITAGVVVTREVSAAGCALLFIMIFSLFFETKSKISRGVLLVAQFWIGIVILAKMMFQLRTVPKHYLQHNCSGTDFNVTEVTDDAVWIGLRQLRYDESLSYYIGGYVLLLVELTILAIFRTHQYYVEKARPEQSLPDEIVFSSVTYKNFDNSLFHLLRYLINSAFYKFGLELSFLTSVIVVSYRQDVVGSFYIILLCLLIIFLTCGRRYVALIWGQYFVCLAILLALQYSSALGLPQGFCYSYPWLDRQHSDHTTNLLWKWLYLPNYVTPPPVHILIADCIQLLIVALQWHVFKAEHDEAHPMVVRSGSNKELGYKAPEDFFEMHDFIESKRNFVDVLKSVIFSYGFWISIATLFVTGTQNINFYCFGYLIFCFYFIWHGLDFTMKRQRDVIKWWNCVLAYNIFVILAKTWLQLLGCVFLESLLTNPNVDVDNTKTCYAVEFFSIRCLNPQFKVTNISGDTCGVSAGEAGLTWDIVCFFILLLQRRIFMSSYFLIVVCEDKTQANLASEGAKMISRMLKKKISKQRAVQLKELRAIKEKLERIRLRTQRLCGESRDDWTHFEVIRSCEPHMLEDIDDDEATTIVGSSEDTGLGSDYPSMSDFSEGEKGNPFKMIVTALDSGMKSSIDAVDKSKADKSPSTLRKRTSSSLSVESTDSQVRSAGAGWSKSRSPKSPLVPEDVLVEVDETDDSGPVAQPPQSSQPTGEAELPESGDEPKAAAPATADEAADNQSMVTADDEQHPFTSSLKEDVQTTDIWLKTFLTQCIKWIITHLNVISWDYRIVAKALDKKQIAMKVKMRKQMAGRSEDDDVQIRAVRSEMEEHQELELGETEAREELEKKSLIYRLFNALFLAFVARTEFLCYFTMILCFMCNGSLLSLPLPVLAMAWGMLSLPRPAKTFWICVLTYVMIVVVIKFIFQFHFWPFSNDVVNSWSDARMIIGISTTDVVKCTSSEPGDCAPGQSSSKDYYAKYELAVLLSVFIHRTVLKRYGLWRNDGEQQEQLDDDARQVEESPSNIDGFEFGEQNPAADIDETSSADRNAVVDREIVHFSTSVDEREEARDQEAAAISEAVVRNGADPDTGSNEQQQLIQELEGQDTTSRLQKSKKRWGCYAVVRWFDDLKSGRMFSKGDYYSRMVLCDFINFIISVIAFQSFGPPQNGTVKDYIQENRVPVPFLILLLCQFILMVIDRAIYLKKNVLGKLIFNIILIVVVHVWVMFILPALTGRAFINNTVAQLWYFIKCVYFGLSAWQIKSGYPTGVLGNFLTTKYTYFNLVLFKIFMAIPFLLELRCIMDWMWTETSFSLGTWLQMEDIFAKIYTIKCFRVAEKTYPTERGKNRGACLKYGLGGFSLISLLLIIWFPLLIFSFANTIYNPNPPISAQVTVGVSGFQNLVTVKSQAMGVRNINSDELEDLKEHFASNSAATGFIDNFDLSDITIVRLPGSSTATWGITPPNKHAFTELLNGTENFSFTITMEFTRSSKLGLSSGSITTQTYYGPIGNNSEVRLALLDQMNGTSSQSKTVLPSVLPRYVHLPVTGEPSPAASLLCTSCYQHLSDQPGAIPYQGLYLQYTENNDVQWWAVGETTNCTQTPVPKCSGQQPKNLSELYFVTFSDRVAPDAVSFITGPGILGLYIGMVFVVGQFVRTLTSGQAYTIMFDELPNVDRILRICRDLYFVREHKELMLEEELFSRLVYLYRSPEMLIKWTRLKQR